MLVVPRGSGDVVAQGGQGSPPEVHLLGYHIMVDQEASQFQVGVGDGASGVLERHQQGPDPVREGGSPDDGNNVGVGSGR